jgi:hypothetical protein
MSIICRQKETAMGIHERLLEKAREAGARLAEAEKAVSAARTEYHGLVRRIHLAGASLREIAAALGLSHQRVQQMVDGAGGSWWQRVWSTRNRRRGLACTFCRRPQDEVEKLIAGPKVFICDACVALAEQSLAGAAAGGSQAQPKPPSKGARTRCSFCGKRRTAELPLLAGPAVGVCRECLDACRQILSDIAS